jgi:hydrogenase maturation protein HypF
MPASESHAVACRRIRVRGQVQGVGFRPFVHRLARELELAGWVRNDGQGVEIEAQGSTEALDALLLRLPSEAPRLARVARVESREVPLAARAGFTIAESEGGAADTGVTPDAAVCEDCLAELFDPADRRWRYPFINCTHCGPRFTITRALPYDRPQTSMAAFAQCAPCAAEYRAPEHRRFHAQPNACADCGPRLTLTDSQGEVIGCADTIAETVRRLLDGEIVAIKGLGGFHLACNARDPAAVARLRARKQREEKPFAVLLANAVSAESFAFVDDQERVLLESAERPVVLLRKREGVDVELNGIAPGIAWLGVMLPYTPLHFLLFHQAAGSPSGTAWLGEAQPLALVMTSANPGGEPIVQANDEALRRLGTIADCILAHDRDIATRCDDSVVRATEAVAGASRGSLQFIRRSRGYTPRAIALAAEGPSVLAVGGYLKNTFCLTRGREAFVSQHIGDLDNAATCGAFDEAVARLTDLLQIRPERVVHDLHPDFYSSRFAVDYAARHKLPALAVQHHHAHIAALAAEHRLTRPLLGLALDGVGLGSDGEAWGGELLLVEGAGFTRLGRLRPLQLPGGDRAAREPWRMAAAALHLAGRDGEIARRFARQRSAEAVARLLAAGARVPRTSSCGRWFDAAAGLLGVREIAAYEGQAAMLLEGLAEEWGEAAALPAGYSLAADGELDLTPLIAWVADSRQAAFASAVFHATLADALAQWLQQAAQENGVREVALGGGCFLNRVLSRQLRARLQACRLAVFEARQVPPNDGGLSLGQAWIGMLTRGLEG